MKIFKAYSYSAGRYVGNSTKAGKMWTEHRFVKASMRSGELRRYHPDDIEIRCWEIGDNEFKALSNDEPPEIA